MHALTAMTAFTIRNIPEGVAASIKLMAARAGKSTERYLREAIIGMAGAQMSVPVAPAKNNSLVREPEPESLPREPVIRPEKCTKHRMRGCRQSRDCVEELTGERPEVQEWA